MAAGLQPSRSQLDQQVTSIVLALRTDMTNVQQVNAYLQNLGVAGLTAAPLSYTAADAQALLTVFANLDSIRVMAQGGAYTGPALPFNFTMQTVPLWGAQ